MSYRDSYSRSDSRSGYSNRDDDRDRYRDYDRGSSSRHRDMPLDCKVYVGDLPERTSERDIYEHFERCGPLKNVWVARNPPGFAFVEFVDHRDADDAVRKLDGISLNGSKIRVEHSTGKVKQKSWNRPRGPPRMRRPFNPDDRCFECQRTGHYAYDCPNVGRRSRRRSRSRSGGRGRRSYSRSHSRSRSFSRSRSRSRSNDRRRDRSRSRSRSHHSDRSSHHTD